MFDTITVEGNKTVTIFTPAFMADDKIETAWEGARTHVKVRPDFGWMMGRFVAADTFNENGHWFDLADLERNHPMIPTTPLNMLHRAHHVIGTFVASELLYPTPEEVAALTETGVATPHVETLAAIWKYRFPEEYHTIQEAHAQGMCWLSMEAWPEALTCREEDGCGQRFPFDGVTSDSYCEHLNRPRSRKILHNPLFLGGASVVPPARPGWKRADVAEVASLIEAHMHQAEQVHAQLKTITSGFSDAQLEIAMATMLTAAGLEAPPPRAAHVAVGFEEEPLPEITDEVTLLAALMWYQKAKRKKKAKDHIVERARELLLESLLPAFFVNDVPLAEPTAEALATYLEDAAASPKSVIVCAVPPGPVTASLAKMATETADMMHVTMAFLGTPDADGLLQNGVSKDQVTAVLALFCAATPPVGLAKISGLGKFIMPDGSDCVYASVDSPNLSDVRARLMSALEVANIEVITDHGFDPHIALAYAPAGEGPTEQPEPLEWQIDTLSVWWGGEHIDYPMARQAATV